MRRTHVLAVPHTISTSEYSSCAFTQKVVKLCRMLKALGHHVIHYGHERSVVACDEHVSVTTDSDLERSYPGHDWRTQSFPPFKLDDPIYRAFSARTIAALLDRARPRDFLLCPFGLGHKAVADAFPDLIVIESGIGYPSVPFARWRVYESYAVMHINQGRERLERASGDMWYDVVIPNAFDLDEFDFSDTKDGEFLFLGRIGEAKGTHIAIDAVKRIGATITVAGPGEVGADPDVRPVGVVGPDARRQLLSRAKAVFCPSMYLEPFCGVQIEAFLSGTPVISTDWGAFTEYNLHGITGYRCRTMEQFEWAARNVHRIQPIACRQWAERNFSLDRVAEMYDEYFWSVAMVSDGQGWYHPNPLRTAISGPTRIGPD